MARKPSRKKTSGKAAVAPAEAAIDAALQLAGLLGWRHVRMADIAEEANLSLGELYRLYPTRVSLLAAAMARVDRAVLDGVAASLRDEPVRDRLFDLLMRRFDALQLHHRAMANIVRDVLADPLEAACLGVRLGRSMAWMLEAAGIGTVGVVGLARVKGLSAVYLATLRVWLGDESEDLGPTMAALDRNLRRAERLVSLLPGRRRGPQAAATEAA